MTSLREHAERFMQTFPAFFLVGLFFCALVQWGSPTVRNAASSALTGWVSAPAIVLLFIASAGLTGITLLVFGTVSSTSNRYKLACVVALVDRPACFVVDLLIPMLAAILALVVSCLFFGYDNNIAGLVSAFCLLALFAGFNIGLPKLTQRAILHHLGAEIAGGRIVGGCLICLAIVLTYTIPHVKPS